MRLAFSTLGVPAMPVEQVIRLASEHGYHGVELRASDEEPVHAGLSAGERAAVAEQFAQAGIEILTVAAYAKVAAPGDDGPVLDEIGAALTLASDLGASYVRVFPGGGGPAHGRGGRTGRAAAGGGGAGRRGSRGAGAAGDARLAPGRRGRGPGGWAGSGTSRCRRDLGRDAHLAGRGTAVGDLPGAGALPGLRAGEGHRLGDGHHTVAARGGGTAAGGDGGGAQPGGVGRLAVLGVREEVVRGRR